MRRTTVLRSHWLAMLAMTVGLSWGSAPARAQEGGGRGMRPAPTLNEVVAIRAGHLFDPRSGTLLANQIILIKGDRITAVGSGLAIPAGAQVIDLSRATVLPGLIDGHVHLLDESQRRHIPVSNGGQGEASINNSARPFMAYYAMMKDLNAGFTTIVDLGHDYTYATVDLRNAIDDGLVQGPRMQVAGPILVNEVESPRYPNSRKIDTPEKAREAVRELKAHGVNWIKIQSTAAYTMKPGSMDSTPTISLEMTKAIVDEAHKNGLKVACHSYSGEGLHNCIEGGADAPQHGMYLDDQSLKEILDRHIALGTPLFDMRGSEKAEMEKFGESRMHLMEQAWKKAFKAGVKLEFSSGAQADSTGFPHGDQVHYFAVFVKWGMTPAQALKLAMIDNAEIIGWADRVGSVEKGKFADIIAVAGDPLADITEIERVKFVMKGGEVVRNDFK